MKKHLFQQNTSNVKCHAGIVGLPIYGIHCKFYND